MDIAIDPWGTDHRAVTATFTVTPGVAAPYVAVDDRLVTAGDPITIRYHGPADSVALAMTDGSPPIFETSLPAADGTLGIPTLDGVPPGDLQVSLIAGGQVVSRTPVWVAAPDAPVTLAAGASTYPVGAPIEVSWRDAPGSRWD